MVSASFPIIQALTCSWKTTKPGDSAKTEDKTLPPETTHSPFDTLDEIASNFFVCGRHTIVDAARTAKNVLYTLMPKNKKAVAEYLQKGYAANNTTQESSISINELASFIQAIPLKSDTEIYSYIKDLFKGRIFFYCPLYNLNITDLDGNKHADVIASFLEDPNIAQFGSLQCKAAVILLKLFLLNNLKSIIGDESKRTAILKNLTAYQESSYADKKLSPYLSIDSVRSAFSKLIQNEAKVQLIIDGAQPSDVEKEFILLIIILFNYKTKKEFDDMLDRYKQLMANTDNYSDTNDQSAINEAKAMLSPYLGFIDDSAKAHNVPPEFIGAVILATQSLKNDSPGANNLYDGLEQTVTFQNPTMKKYVYPLLQLFSPLLNKIPAPSDDLSDFASGVIMGSAPTTGICQMRAATGESNTGVRGLKAFSRFKIDTDNYSNHRINLMLLDPKLNIEMYAAFLRYHINNGICVQDPNCTNYYSAEKFGPVEYKTPSLKYLNYTNFLVQEYTPFVGPDGFIRDISTGAGYQFVGSSVNYATNLTSSSWRLGDVRNTDYLSPYHYFPEAVELAIQTGLFASDR